MFSVHILLHFADVLNNADYVWPTCVAGYTVRRNSWHK